LLSLMTTVLIAGFVTCTTILAVLFLTSAWLWWRHGLHAIIVVAGVDGLAILPAIIFFVSPGDLPLAFALGGFVFVTSGFVASFYATLGRRITSRMPPRRRDYQTILRDHGPGLDSAGLFVLFYYPAVAATILVWGAAFFMLIRYLDWV